MYIIQKTGMIPSLYDGTHYVTNQKLPLEILKEISVCDDVLEITGEYSGSCGSIGSVHDRSGKDEYNKIFSFKDIIYHGSSCVAAIAIMEAGSLKMTDAQQQLSPPILPPSAEVKPQPKTISPAEQTTQFKNVLNECSAAVNAHTPDVNNLQSCDQKMSSIRAQCDKSQMDHSICDDAGLRDYINKRGNSNP